MWRCGVLRLCAMMDVRRGEALSGIVLASTEGLAKSMRRSFFLKMDSWETAVTIFVACTESVPDRCTDFR
jgi:hypothetical protein